MTVAIDWENLGFAYMKLPYRYIAHYKNGQESLQKMQPCIFQSLLQVSTMDSKHLRG